MDASAAPAERSQWSLLRREQYRDTDRDSQQGRGEVESGAIGSE